jgi:RNA polymerase sigma-70 factor (ECF subfamily)
MGRNKEERSINEQERNELFAKYITPNLKLVYRTVMDYTLNSSDIEDNYQESLINLLDYIHTYDPERNIQTWIITCTIRFVGKLEAARGIRAKNSDKQKKTYLEKYAPKGKLKMAYIEETVSVLRVQDKTHGYDEKKLSDEVEKAITTIKPTYARAFLFRHMVGMNLDEIAEMEGINKNMAKHRVHMAKVLLQEKLGVYERVRD